MKKYTFLLMLCISFISVSAQTITIVDKQNLTSIKGAIVRLDNNETTISNNKGTVNIDNLQSKKNIRISYIGYTTVITTGEEIANAKYVVYLTEKSYNTEEVVISATRFEETSNKIAQQIAVIKAKNIAQNNLQTSADLLQNTGLVNVQKSQAGGGSPIIRGFEANKVLMVVDGVRMNNAIYRGGHLQNVITMDQNSLERMEVMFGAGSLMYGSDALGGVIHFYTKEPKFSNTDDLEISGSAFSRYTTINNEKSGHVDLALATKKFASLSSFNISDFGDLKQGKNRSSEWGNLGIRKYYQGRINGIDTMLINDDSLVQKESGYTQYDFMQKFLFKQSEKITHVLNFQYSTSSNIPRYDRLTELNSSGKFRSAEWYYGPQERMFLSYQARIGMSKIYDKAQITLAYQGIEESRHNRNWNSSKLNHRIENVKVYSLNADFDKMIGKIDMQYGLEYVYNDVTSTANAENINTGVISKLDTRYPNGGSNTNSASIYTTGQREISEKVVVNAGIRLSNYSLKSNFGDKTFFPFPYDNIEQSSTSLTAQTGIVYKPANTWKLGMNLATGFRNPNVDDLAKVFESTKGDTIGNNSKVGSLIVPNPDLKPEQTLNMEFSISKTIADKLQLTGIFFATKFQNAIVTQNSTFNGLEYIPYGDTVARVQKNVNANEATIYGFTAIANYDITTSLSASASYNYTKGTITSVSPNTPLDHISPAFGRISMVYKAKKMRTELFCIYNGAKKLADYNLGGEDNLQYATPNGMPSWYTLNLRYSYQVTKYFQAQVNLDNLTDNAYRVFASGINGGGRSVSLTLRGNF